MRATNNQVLADIAATPDQECFIQIGDYPIYMNILPDITDSKSASYADESAIGRTMPFKTYQYSENRTIGWTAHFVIQKETRAGTQGVVTVNDMFEVMRNIESAVYPFSSEDSGYLPPIICKLKCGKLLQGAGELNAVMKSYSIKFDTSVPWDFNTLMPYKMDIDMQFDVVYNQTQLPGAEMILFGGYGPG